MASERPELDKKYDINWLDIFEEELEKGNYIVGKKIHRAIFYWKWILVNRDVQLDIKEGNKIIKLIENEFTFDGKNYIKLSIIQKAIFFMYSSLREKDDKTIPYFKELFIEVGRGFGKSTIIAAVQAAQFILNNKDRKEYFNIASTKEQAKSVALPMTMIIRNSPIFKKLGFEVQGSGDNIKVLRKQTPEFLGGIKALDKNGLQGLDVQSLIFDECHTYSSSALYDTAKAGLKNERALFITITTNGDVRGGYLDYVLDRYDMLLDKNNFMALEDRVLPFMFEIDDYANFNTEIEAQKANPHWNLPFFQRRKNDILAELEIGKKLGYSTEFKTTVFNMNVTSSSALLDYEDLNYDMSYDFDKEYNRIRERDGRVYLFGGIDLAKVHDATVACVIMYDKIEDKIYSLSKSFFSQEAYDHHLARGYFPIDTYVNNGCVEINGIKNVNQIAVVDWFNHLRNEKQYPIEFVGYDPSEASKLKEFFLEKMYWDDNNFLIKIPQSAGMLSEQMVTLQNVVKNQCYYNNDPFAHYMLGNIEIKEVLQGSTVKWLPDNSNRSLLHDYGSAILTALATRYQFKKKYNAIDA